MRKLHISFYMIILLVLAGCSSGERWEGYVYPDKDNLLMHRNSGEFDSLEECEAASMEILKSMSALQKGYYECGKNCDPGSSHYNRHCEDNILGNYYK